MAKKVEDQKMLATYSWLMDRAYRKMRQYTRKENREAGIELTIEQFVILKSLKEEDQLSQTELADRVMKDNPTVTRMLDLLCERGFTQRHPDPEDRRKYLISLTEAGHQEVERTLPHIMEIRAQGWKGLSFEDMEHFNRILRKIADNFS